MKILVAICVLSLLTLPAAIAQPQGSTCFSEFTQTAQAVPSFIDFELPLVSDFAAGSPGMSCDIDLRCGAHFQCELACGMACGLPYGGICAPAGDPNDLETDCECYLIIPE